MKAVKKSKKKTPTPVQKPAKPHAQAAHVETDAKEEVHDAFDDAFKAAADDAAETMQRHAVVDAVDDATDLAMAGLNKKRQRKMKRMLHKARVAAWHVHAAHVGLDNHIHSKFKSEKKPAASADTDPSRYHSKKKMKNVMKKVLKKVLHAATPQDVDFDEVKRVHKPHTTTTK